MPEIIDIVSVNSTLNIISIAKPASRSAADDIYSYHKKDTSGPESGFYDLFQETVGKTDLKNKTPDESKTMAKPEEFDKLKPEEKKKNPEDQKQENKKTRKSELNASIQSYLNGENKGHTPSTKIGDGKSGEKLYSNSDKPKRPVIQTGTLTLKEFKKQDIVALNNFLSSEDMKEAIKKAEKNPGKIQEKIQTKLSDNLDKNIKDLLKKKFPEEYSNKKDIYKKRLSSKETEIKQNHKYNFQELDTKKQSVKNSKNKIENTQVRQAETDPVSRETSEKIPVNDINNSKESKTQDQTGKQTFSDKISGMDSLKKDMNSNMSSFQGNEGGSSKSAGERSKISGKTDNNLFQRSNIQRQVETILSRARTIVRSNGDASLSTNLYPKELGKISIKLTLVDGVLKGQFTVENETVQKELLHKMDKIMEEMKLDGFEVEEFNVNVNSGQTERNLSGNENKGVFTHTFQKESQLNLNQIVNSNENKVQGLYA